MTYAYFNILCRIVTKIGRCRQIVLISNMKFHENSPGGSTFVQAKDNDEANSHFS
jgi:hypothetical protein